MIEILLEETMINYSTNSLPLFSYRRVNVKSFFFSFSITSVVWSELGSCLTYEVQVNISSLRGFDTVFSVRLNEHLISGTL